VSKQPPIHRTRDRRTMHSNSNDALIYVLHFSQAPEVFRAMLTHLHPSNKGTIVNAACVSRSWSAAALDVLYETIDAKDLLLLFGPTKKLTCLDDEFVCWDDTAGDQHRSRVRECFSDLPLVS
jgi:hypothetical protein